MTLTLQYFWTNSLSALITIIIGMITQQHLMVVSGASSYPTSYCEHSRMDLMCNPGEVVHIDSDTLQYGLLDEQGCFEMTSSIPTNVSKIYGCTADSDHLLRVILDKCAGKRECDRFTVNDTIFGLGPGFGECPYLDVIDSQLFFSHSCLPEPAGDEESRRDPTATATLPTRGPELTIAPTSERCHANQSKDEGCFRWICDQGSWRKQSVLLDDPLCCTLWEHGCNGSTMEATTTTNVLTETVSTMNSSSTSTDVTTTAGLLEVETTEIETSALELSTTETLTTEQTATETSETTIPITTTETLTTTTTTTTTISTTTSKTSPKTSTFAHPEITVYVKDCPIEYHTPPHNFTWDISPGNTTRAVPCPGDHRAVPSVVYRRCKVDGKWSDKVDISQCASPNIVNYVKKNLGSGEELEEYAAGLANITSTENLLSGDIGVLANALMNIGTDLGRLPEKQPAEVINITQNVFTVGDNLLRKGGKKAWQGVEEKEKSTKTMQVLTALEFVARESAYTLTSDLTVKTPSIELKVKVIDLTNVSRDQSINVTSQGGFISFPAENLVADQKGSDYGKFVTVFYNSSSIWSSQGNQTINTPVFTASILERKRLDSRRQLSSPFIYALPHQKRSDNSHQCVFWDEPDVLGTTGKWSADGCRRVEGTDGYSVCECDHLTNFAVLLDVTGVTGELTAAQTLSLQIITYAGCIISIVCLLLSWLTFQCLKNLNSDRNTIHKHLVFTLMLAESLFLVSISPQVVELQVFCSVLAGVLHFLFLSVFAWTCLEGVQLYIMLIEVFESGRSRIWYYYLAGYGIPALVVGISAAVDHEGYGTPSVCWLKTDTGFIWSFVGPVAAVMLVNLVMLGIAIYMMYNHAQTVANIKHKETKKIDSIRAWVKGAVVLVVLLGLTWVFGFLYINKDTLVMAYIFTILNSLQGVFIFIFHCFGNEKVQKEYKKYVRRTQWLPDCIRASYGEHKGLSSSISHSSASNGYLSRYFSRRRKSSDLTSGSLRSKKQMSGLSTNSNANTDDENFNISRVPLTSPSQKISSPLFHDHTEINEQDENLMPREEFTPSYV